MPQQCDRLPAVVNLHRLRTKASIITPGRIQANIFTRHDSSTTTTSTSCKFNLDAKKGGECESLVEGKLPPQLTEQIKLYLEAKWKQRKKTRFNWAKQVNNAQSYKPPPLSIVHKETGASEGRRGTHWLRCNNRVRNKHYLFWGKGISTILRSQ